jgi:AcrR family transcriptional regulator
MNVKDDTRQRLLEAAGEVFAEKGFRGATVREIIQRAGANIAAVNYYFRDKESLYIETVKSACACQSEAVPLPQWPAGTPPTQKLRDFIHTILNRMLDKDGPAWHKQLFLREMAQPTAACEVLVQNHIRPSAQLLAGILAELLPDVPEGKRRLIAFSIIGQCLFHSVARPIVELLVGKEEHRRYDAAFLEEHIAEFSLAALGQQFPCWHPADRAAAKQPRE